MIIVLSDNCLTMSDNCFCFSKRMGQLFSIDKAYSIVKSEYIFHCEDDWVLFFSSIFLFFFKNFFSPHCEDDWVQFCLVFCVFAFYFSSIFLLIFFSFSDSPFCTFYCPLWGWLGVVWFFFSFLFFFFIFFWYLAHSIVPPRVRPTKTLNPNLNPTP